VNESNLHPCGCSIKSGNMIRCPKGTFVEATELRSVHADTCKFKNLELGASLPRGVMARGADGDMPRDTRGTWSTLRSSPNGPTQLKWNLDPGIPWSLGSVLNYPRNFWRDEYRRRVRGEKT
jgi:hypothetical protein